MDKPRVPSLLSLPAEVRHDIYSYCGIFAEPMSHPISGVGITSVTHRPPPTNMLLMHPLLTSDIEEYYYNVATWKILLSHAMNFFRVDPKLSNLAQWHHLHMIQKVEIVFFCDVLLVKDYPSFGLDRFCVEIKRRAARACEILNSSAPSLRRVVVSWIDTTETGAWDVKAKVLEPLQTLHGKVTFGIGEMLGPEAADAESFIVAIRRQLDYTDEGEADLLDQDTVHGLAKASPERFSTVLPS